jgi:hypothetical protein
MQIHRAPRSVGSLLVISAFLWTATACPTTERERDAEDHWESSELKETEPQPGAAGVEKITLTAVVREIDLGRREVTLEGPLGNVSTFRVDKRVERLDEVKVGDQVKVEYLAAVSAELRPPTAEEKANPFVILDATGMSSPGAPAASDMRMIRIVGSIVGMDSMAGKVIVQGPLGRQVKVRIDDPLVFGKIEIGQTVVLLFAEEEVVSLVKVP